MPEVLDKLPADLAKPISQGSLRIDLTNQPMHNVQNRSDLNELYAEAYAKAGENKYATGLRNGTMIMIGIQGDVPSKIYKPGELFFTS